MLNLALFFGVPLDFDLDGGMTRKWLSWLHERPFSL